MKSTLTAFFSCLLGEQTLSFLKPYNHLPPPHSLICFILSCAWQHSSIDLHQPYSQFVSPAFHRPFSHWLFFSCAPTHVLYPTLLLLLSALTATPYSFLPTCFLSFDLRNLGLSAHATIPRESPLPFFFFPTVSISVVVVFNRSRFVFAM